MYDMPKHAGACRSYVLRHQKNVGCVVQVLSESGGDGCCRAIW
jgi:hypothetical protein